MQDRSGYIAGQLADWPTKERMAQVLRAAGLRVMVGRYCIRVEDCSHFVFQEYGADVGEPQIDADADSGPAMLREAAWVSSALSQAGIRHRFEIHDHSPEMVGYLHHGWPLSPS